MPSSRFSLASAAKLLALLAIGSQGLPSNGLIERQQRPANTGIPGYCDPGAPLDYQNMAVYDVSDQCNRQGIPGNCCVTFIDGATPCPTGDFSGVSTPDVQDLDIALYEQLNKTKWDDITKRGKWVLSFSLFADKPVPVDIVDELYSGPLHEFIGNATQQHDIGGVAWIYFYVGGANGPQRIAAQWVC